MSVDLDRVRTAVRAFADAAPVTAPPPAVVRARAEVMAAGRGRRWLVPALAAGSVLTLVAAIVWLPGLVRPEAPAGSGQDGGGPVLPARFAELSSHTVWYAESWPGPAIALYHQGNLAGGDPSQQLLVGADGRTYRRLNLADMEGVEDERPWNGVQRYLLSPDGMRLVTPDLSVVDLDTGDATSYQQISYGMTPLAWSHDGQRIAFGMAPTEQRGPVDDGAVAVVDLDTGQVSRIGTGTFEPRAVAFSPSGEQLAIHAEVADPDAAWTDGNWVPEGGAVQVYDLAGNLLQEIPLSDRQGLAPGGTAWSPDGELLALIETRGDPPVHDLRFFDAAPPIAAPPEALRVGKEELVLLGWRSPTTALVGWDDGTARGTNLIVEVPVDGGQPRTISQLPLDENGWVTGLQLAPGLAAVADVRDPGRPARGPWLEVWMTEQATPFLIPAALLVVFAAILVGMERRRRRASPRAGA